MNKLKSIIFSMPLTGALLILFAISIAFATFIENDYGTVAAKAAVYKARWFEFLLLLLVVNLAGSIFRHKMFSGKKIGTLLFHLSFLLIFIGAATTRYAGFEGMMPIREGGSSNTIISDETYISIVVNDGTDTVYKESKILLSPVTRNKFKTSVRIGDHKLRFRLTDFIHSAATTIVDAPGGDPYLSLVVSDSVSGMQTFLIKEGEEKKVGYPLFSFGGKSNSGTVMVNLINDTLYFDAYDSVYLISMGGGPAQTFAPDSIIEFREKSLYKIGATSFVLKKFHRSAKQQLVSSSKEEGMTSMDGLIVRVTGDNIDEEMQVLGTRGLSGKFAEINTEDLRIGIKYGSKNVKLPFFIKLRDFQLERYPGSSSPSSYASEVTVLDPSGNLEIPYRIFMNNVLNYRGYRFFQSSYDPDEMGTVLSVNYDQAGTWITYLGYFLMSLGMIVALFSNNSRFKKLFRTGRTIRQSRTTTGVLILALLFSGSVYSQDIADDLIIDKSHAEKFGELLIQDHDGRIKPINTLASEFVRKVIGKSTFNGLAPEQVFLGMFSKNSDWQKIPMIKISNPQLKDFLGIKGRYAAFLDLVDIKGTRGYIIADYVEKAYQKSPALRNKFDNEVMKVDERMNIAYMVYTGGFLKIFPIPDDPENNWKKTGDHAKYFSGHDEREFVKMSIENYKLAIREALESGEWGKADRILIDIKDFQNKYGKTVIPPSGKIKMEIFYNNNNIFGKLARYYGLVGFILLILHFINILRPALRLRVVVRISAALVILLFLIHTAGLVIRWYISGHAPWSDGYESMIYIAWATILSGILFYKRAEITLSATSLLASLILSVAGLSWMDPEITNLVPVLKSYWLIIHVAII
ncbi:MAG: cytochrome c biogenesis protein ResB, partial [Bacteroidales bacterium]|nr:cytochrome c biogenesis protein ResB [Bacteroidales bacterium]